MSPTRKPNILRAHASQEFDAVEFYAGRGNLTRFMKLAGYKEYTPQFARQVVDLYEDLVRTPRGLPHLPIHVPAALDTFQAMSDHCDLEFVELEPVFNYLRRSKHLVIPLEWRDHIPKPRM
ncbi:unnamed protein product [Durusdinium trenchii]|uniref:Uncharacterized protein n=1 Tax=Durusdinium trenchii TaxID=1381693 RepID=A0ABP0NMI9_9DINO